MDVIPDTVMPVQFIICVPATNTRGPQYMDQALATIHQANPGRLPLALTFEQRDGQVSLCCSFPPELRAIYP